MRITKLILKNFGIHKYLEINSPNDTSVGIVGRNGGGKSTILTAIKYAFTAQLPRKAETFISNGTKTSSVELWFTKDGKEGHIMRELGGKRSLEFDGKSCTSAKEVDSTLESILSVNKDLVGNAVFIAQGTLPSLVDATESNRIAIYSKLLNIGYFEKLSDYASTECRSAELDLKEETGKKKAYEEELNTISEELRQLEAKYENQEYLFKIPNLVKALINQSANKTEMVRLDEAIKNKEYSIRESLNDIKLFEEKIEGKSEQEYTQFISSTRETISSFNNNIQTLKTAKEKLEQLMELTQQLAKLPKPKDGMSVEQLEEIKTSRYELAQKCESLSLLLDKKISLEQTTNRLPSLIEDENKKLEALNATINSLKAMETSLSVSVKTMEQSLKFKKLLRGKLDKGSTTCPNCGLKILGDQEISDENLKQLNDSITIMGQQLAKQRDEIFKKEEEYKTLQGIVNKNNINLANALQELRDIEPRIKILQPECEGHTYTECMDAYNDAKSQIELAHKVESIRSNMEIIKNSNELVANWYANGMESSIEAANVRISGFEQAVDENQKKLNEAIQNKASYISIMSNISSANRYVSQYTKELDELKKRRAFINTELPKEIQYEQSHLMSKMGFSENETSVFVEEIKQKADSIKSDMDDMDRKRDRVKTLKDLIGNLESSPEYKIKLSRLTKLQIIKNALSKSSIPATYLQSVFEVLVDSVSEYLSIMQTPFSIRSSSTEALAFEFTVDGNYWMPMSAFSGGQKTRIAIALLLSIQKIICPNVSFISLDEPSNALDADSVNELVQLLSMFTQTRIIEQFWVVDHNPLFERAFDQSYKIQN